MNTLPNGLMLGHASVAGAASSSTTFACNCRGPQNGQPVCPCMMRDVRIIDGRYVKIQDLGPAPNGGLPAGAAPPITYFCPKCNVNYEAAKFDTECDWCPGVKVARYIPRVAPPLYATTRVVDKVSGHDLGPAD